MKTIKISFVVNGKKEEREIPPNISLLALLRDHLGLTGAKKGCETGECGACTVIVDGKAVNSCIVLASQINGKSIQTIEGLGTETSLHPLQKAFVEKGAVQCGFCTPGMLMSLKALYDESRHVNREDIKRAISGNLCRCTGYQQIVEAAESVFYKGK
ncbi:MAG: (2Fe-2S)-binding protein [Deltaproteobacteria bacterium]|nr:(2Fe-2S)-binding protein [Deltaproteobacteria bacterium]MBW2077373.1 (2Fe-2S)-binding protein [Deltaproteobacteria bacterium]